MEKKDYGLVFGGGGGKGAYQIGVWKALRQLGMDGWIKAVSGDSVGGLNALLFANGDEEKAEQIWTDIRPIQFLDIEPEGVCSRDGLLRIMRKELSLSEIASSETEIYVNVAYCPEEPEGTTEAESALNALTAGRTFEGEYIRLNGKAPEEIEAVLLATSAMPVVYAPVTVNGRPCRDGGLFDNLPMRPLLENNFRNLIVVPLNHEEYDVILAAGAEEFILIEPSGDIGHLLTGTLDFDGRNVSYRIWMGFYDTLRTIEFYERRMMGFPPDAAEKASRIEDDLRKARANANAANAFKDAETHMNQYQSILDRYLK